MSLFFVKAFNQSLLLLLCTVTINVLVPRAFNPESCASCIHTLI
jgi:hypothetical protein